MQCEETPIDETPPLVLTTAEIAVAPDTVDMGHPIAAVADGAGTAVIWTAAGVGARLTMLDQDGSRARADIALPGDSAHALTATPNGFAALLRRISGDDLWLVEVDRAGVVLLETRVAGGVPRDVITGVPFFDPSLVPDSFRGQRGFRLLRERQRWMGLCLGHVRSLESGTGAIQSLTPASPVFQRLPSAPVLATVVKVESRAARPPLVGRRVLRFPRLISIRPARAPRLMCRAQPGGDPEATDDDLPKVFF